jgi:hypothetical protein
MTLSGLVRDGDPTVLDSTGLHVTEFLRWMWPSVCGTEGAWLSGLLMEECAGPKHVVGLVVDDTMLLLLPPPPPPPTLWLETELDVWGLQLREDTCEEAELTC